MERKTLNYYFVPRMGKKQIKKLISQKNGLTSLQFKKHLSLKIKDKKSLLDLLQPYLMINHKRKYLNVAKIVHFTIFNDN